MYTKKMFIVGLTFAISGMLAFSLVDFVHGATINHKPSPMDTNGSDAKTADSSNENHEEKQEIRIYEVFGMECPACHGVLNKLVKKSLLFYNRKLIGLNSG